MDNEVVGLLFSVIWADRPCRVDKEKRALDRRKEEKKIKFLLGPGLRQGMSLDSKKINQGEREGIAKVESETQPSVI